MKTIPWAAANDVSWRGLDLYDAGNVIESYKVDENNYAGKVKGSNNNVYDVVINLLKPRASTCTCPFAQGRYIVCKHEVALYFDAIDHAKETYLKEVDEMNRLSEEEDERLAQEHHDEIVKFVKTLTKKELQERLVAALEELDESNKHGFY